MSKENYTRYFPDSWENHGYVIIKKIDNNTYEVEAKNGEHFNMKKVKFEVAFQELDIMSRFRHYNITKADQVFFDGNYVYIITTLSDNTAIELLRSPNKGIDIEVRIRFLYEIISGLHLLQKYNVIHCDINPDNIMMYNTSDNYINAHAKIGDIGSTKYLNSDVLLYQTYSSPEEIIHNKSAIIYDSINSALTMNDAKIIDNLLYDQTKATMYALGITMAEILSGKQFEKGTIQNVPKYVYYLMENSNKVFIAMGIDKEWIQLLSRLVNIDINMRPSIFSEILKYSAFEKRSYNVPISGGIFNINTVGYCNKYLIDSINMGMEDMIRLKADISVAALFIELLRKSFLKIIITSKGENVILLPLFTSALIYLSSCLIGIPIKQNISRDNHVKILDMIYLIYVNLDGIIYTETIYSKAHSSQIIKKLMKLALMDCNEYLSKSLDNHILLVEEEETPLQRSNRNNKKYNRDIEYYLL